VIYQPAPPNFLEEARALIEAHNINNAYEFIEYAMNDRLHGDEYFAAVAGLVTCEITPFCVRVGDSLMDQDEWLEGALSGIKGDDLTVWVAKFLDRHHEFLVDELGDDIDVVPV
jgi:hypothetical protein